jgi:hypothetical protein
MNLPCVRTGAFISHDAQLLPQSSATLTQLMPLLQISKLTSDPEMIVTVHKAQLSPDHLIPDSDTEVVSENELTFCEKIGTFISHDAQVTQLSNIKLSQRLQFSLSFRPNAFNVQLANSDSAASGRLRNDEKTQDKVRSILAEFHEDEDYRSDLSEDSNEYTPSNSEQRRYCFVNNCDEDVFIACHICPALLCYGHRDSSCDQHNRKDNPRPVEEEPSGSEESEG